MKKNLVFLLCLTFICTLFSGYATYNKGNNEKKSPENYVLVYNWENSTDRNSPDRVKEILDIIGDVDFKKLYELDSDIEYKLCDAFFNYPNHNTKTIENIFKAYENGYLDFGRIIFNLYKKDTTKSIIDDLIKSNSKYKDLLNHIIKAETNIDLINNWSHNKDKNNPKQVKKILDIIDEVNFKELDMLYRPFTETFLSYPNHNVKTIENLFKVYENTSDIKNDLHFDFCKIIFDLYSKTDVKPIIDKVTNSNPKYKNLFNHIVYLQTSTKLVANWKIGENRTSPEEVKKILDLIGDIDYRELQVYVLNYDLSPKLHEAFLNYRYHDAKTIENIFKANEKTDHDTKYYFNVNFDNVIFDLYKKENIKPIIDEVANSNPKYKSALNNIIKSKTNADFIVTWWNSKNKNDPKKVKKILDIIADVDSQTLGELDYGIEENLYKAFLNYPNHNAKTIENLFKVRKETCSNMYLDKTIFGLYKKENIKSIIDNLTSSNLEYKSLFDNIMKSETNANLVYNWWKSKDKNDPQKVKKILDIIGDVDFWKLSGLPVYDDSCIEFSYYFCNYPNHNAKTVENILRAAFNTDGYLSEDFSVIIYDLYKKDNIKPLIKNLTDLNPKYKDLLDSTIEFEEQ